jgi:hypothetical protein
VPEKASGVLAREVIGLDLAAVAIREFLHSGRPHPQLTWRTG